MTSEDNLRALAEHFGILPSFFDVNGHEHFTNDATRKAFLAANGVDVSRDETIAQTLHSLRHDAENRWFPYEVITEAFAAQDVEFGLGAAWQIRRWGRSEIVAEGQAGDFITLPALAPEVYDMRIEVAGRVEHVRVLAAPKTLPLLADVVSPPQIWGITAALYGLQSERATAVGDYVDLGSVCGVAAKAGAGFVGINPVHNMGYADEHAISPYSPSHRGFYHTGHIALDAIPGLENVSEAKEIYLELARAIAPTKALENVDYRPQKMHHKAALEKLHRAFLSSADAAALKAFAAYKDEQGAELERFARFEAISERHGADWRNWPENSGNSEDKPAARLEFHAWLQWAADVQLAAAQAKARDQGMPLGLYLDLSVGSRRDGAESWCEQAAIATGVSIGAPPDQLGPDGQNWDLAAYSPRKLQAAGYAPLRRVLAKTMRHAGVIRIDHVLGLQRSFWIPDDGSPGGYIRQPFDSLIAIIKIEAYLSKTLVIGEDLGLVPEGFRDTTQRHGFYGYSVLQYEKEHDGSFRDPQHGSHRVLTCFGTHDTPTIRGFEAMRDIELWQALDILDGPTAEHMREERRRDIEAIRALTPADVSGFVQAVHGILAASASEMICLQLDDILEQVEPQNLPGTVDEYPNWRRKHSVSLEALQSNAGLASASELMNTYGRNTNR